MMDGNHTDLLIGKDKNRIIELNNNMTLKVAKEIFKSNENSIILIKIDGQKYRIIDKDVMFERMLMNSDEKTLMSFYGINDYSEINKSDDIDEIDSKYLIIKDELGTVLDVIEKKVLIDQVQKKKEDLNVIVNNINQGILAIDSSSYITYFNDRAEEILNKRKSDMLGRRINDVLNSNLLKFMYSDEESQMDKLEGQEGMSVFVYRYKIKSEGKIIGAFSLFEDLSRYENMRQDLVDLKELNNELDAIVENSYDGIYVTQANGDTRRINSSYERITGIKRDEVVGKNMSEIVEKGILSKSITAEVVKKKMRITDEQIAKNGKRILITGNPMFGAKGEVEKVLFNVRDITELTDLKVALKKNAELNELYKRELLNDENDYVYRSIAFENCVTMAKKIANTDMSVLILGETGVGKEVMAKIVHSSSYRANENFIKINCGAIPKDLLESELFGYEPGAFTGANKNGKSGMFELADKGTIFLDEIGELPLDIQVKFLRVLQENEITRIGSTKSTNVDVRIVAATNRNLGEMVSKGEFRRDLYYRLNVIPIMIPPLRERQEDVFVLADFFLSKLNAKYGTHKYFHKEFIPAIRNYDWPGNIRELKNVIERSYAITDSGAIGLNHMLDDTEESQEVGIKVNGVMPLNEAKELVERHLIMKVMDDVNNTYKAAEILKVSQATIARKSKLYMSTKS